MGSKNIIIVAGGTVGHVFPAISVGMLLRERGYGVLFVGNEKMKEYALRFDLPYRVVDNGRELRKIKSLLGLLRGIWQSFRIIREFKPDALIGFGSYVTAPTLMAAKLMGKEFYLHEQNLYVGETNRFFLKYAKRLFTSLQEVYGVGIDQSSKTYFTGNPVRREIKELCDISAYRYPEPNEKFNILITGGSGGSSFLATELLKAFCLLKKHTKLGIAVFHQVKEEEELKIVERFYEKEGISAEVKLFFQDMPDRMLRSHLVICRSGMGTATELTVVGRPTVFVPSPNVKNNHQLRNAKFFERSGACIVMEETSFRPRIFASHLESLINNREKLLELALNMKKLAIVDAEERIVNCIDSDIG
ncbi:MAG: undecaprenyldiphospho-muramoylpentapeptide beta-N-acetylglucosaminyltransferase [Rickettsiales bacterium]|nr:undecaprenyldiphospho-muramoylpentapeptide beta-N-acetylglucosaminyltransferase [Rickettsiales bacterium]